jgi:hypothetical protein
MDRNEHLSWCKRRALKYVDEGDLLEAVTSMGSDLSKHEDFQGPMYDGLFYVGLMFEVNRGREAVRRWIEGFN